MNKITKLLMGTLLLAATSCELESEVYDKISPDNFPTTESDAKALLVGSVYAAFSADGYSNLYSAANGVQTLSDCVADVMTCSWGNDWNLMAFNNHTAETGLLNNNLNQFRWFKYFGGMILTADRIANSPASDKVKEMAVAEAKCGMGFMAFLLYDLYGPIILPTLEELKNPTQDVILPRATEEEMRAFIVDNLTEAARVLPYKWPDGDYGRFTKGLANTLLLKYYMRVKDFKNAETIGKELTENQEYGYAIEDDYYKLFSLEGKRNPEIVYAVPCSDKGQNSLYQVHVYPGDFPHKQYFPNAPEQVTLWGGYRMAWSYYHTFEEGDYRLTRIYGEYTDNGGRFHSEEADKTDGSLRVGAVPGKYSIDGMIGDKGLCDVVVFRFSDVKTLYAEAVVRNSNSVNAMAKEYLNEIRTKHGRLTAFTDEEIGTVDEYLDKLLEERGHEFYMEGVRRQDLIRHGRFVEMCMIKNEYAGHSTANLQRMENGEPVYHLIPLPVSLIREGQGKIVQNPGF